MNYRGSNTEHCGIPWDWGAEEGVQLLMLINCLSLTGEGSTSNVCFWISGRLMVSKAAGRSRRMGILEV